jgi:hypothetical protein
MRSAGADVAVARPEAFLADVYETIVTCDFEVLRNVFPVIAGAEPRAWNDAFARLGPDLTQGRITMAQEFEQILAAHPPRTRQIENATYIGGAARCRAPTQRS